jgi:hypothetical protein
MRIILMREGVCFNRLHEIINGVGHYCEGPSYIALLQSRRTLFIVKHFYIFFFKVTLFTTKQDGLNMSNCDNPTHTI